MSSAVFTIALVAFLLLLCGVFCWLLVIGGASRDDDE